MAFLTEMRGSRRPSKRLWLALLRLVPPSAAYRPERHYMRGPGPKYRARHGGHLSPKKND